MGRKQGSDGLGARQRQIMDAVYRLGEASVGDVREAIEDAPSYSTIRTMIRHLEAKGWLRHREEGPKYVYQPAHSPEAARTSALRHLMRTFFAGSAADAVAALLDPSVATLTDNEVVRLEKLIQDARQRGK